MKIIGVRLSVVVSTCFLIVSMCLLLTHISNPNSLSFRGLTISIKNPFLHGVTRIKKDTVLIGILSKDDHVCEREAQRKTFIARARLHKELDIKVYFLIDSKTPQLQKEQDMYHDILFLNITVHGWEKLFAKKLHTWISFVVKHFPNALMVGKMDDDVYACVPQVFDRLKEVNHPLLYYGYPTRISTKSDMAAVDEMFIFIGIKLAQRIARRPFCSERQETNCLEDGNGGHQFRYWIDIYTDIKFIDEKENNRMVWYYRDFHELYVNVLKLFRTKSFCEDFLVFHKASVSDIYRMTLQNSKLLQERGHRDYSTANTNCFAKYLP